MEELNLKEIIIEGLSFVFGVFLYALTFNLLLNPNNFVVAGFSGVATILEKSFGWNPNLFIYITNFILIIVSFIFLGVSATKRNIAGSFLYPLMLTITFPIAKVLGCLIETEDIYLMILYSIILFGISSGLIYRSGFSTGGSDILIQIIAKYMHINESRAMVIGNAIIIILGMFTFGIDKGVYSFIILICSTYFVDKLTYGIKTSKLFYIYTKKKRQVKNLILKDFNSGLTCIPSKGGYSKSYGYLIMCVVSNYDYYSLKNKILEIDKNAFIVINNCHEVSGGVKRRNIPFL